MAKLNIYHHPDYEDVPEDLKRKIVERYCIKIKCPTCDTDFYYYALPDRKFYKRCPNGHTVRING